MLQYQSMLTVMGRGNWKGWGGGGGGGGGGACEGGKGARERD